MPSISDVAIIPCSEPTNLAGHTAAATTIPSSVFASQIRPTIAARMHAVTGGRDVSHT